MEHHSARRHFDDRWQGIDVCEEFGRFEFIAEGGKDIYPNADKRYRPLLTVTSLLIHAIIATSQAPDYVNTLASHTH